MKQQSFRAYLVFSILIFLGAFTLRMTALHENSFWLDEALTARTVSITKEHGDFVEGVRERLNHLPLYFASLLFYPGDHSDFSLRYPSVLWSILTIAMTMRILTHLYRFRRYALLAALILAIQSFVITQSRTARMYPMSNFLVVSAAYLFLHNLKFRHDNVWQWRRFIIVSLLAYMTHLATVILIPAQSLVWAYLYLRKQISLKQISQWLILQLLILIPTIAWVVVVFERETTRLTWIGKPDLNRLVLTIHQLFFGQIDTGSFASDQILLLGILPLIFFLLALRTKYSIYWAGLTWVPIVGLFVLSQFRPIFHERYFAIVTFAYPITIVLAYNVIDQFLVKRYKTLGSVLMGGLIGVYLLIVSLTTMQRFQNGYFSESFEKQSLEYVLQNSQEEDFLVTSMDRRLVDYYLPNSEIQILDLDSFIYDYEQNQALPSNRVWLIIDESYPWDLLADDDQFQLMSQYLDSNIYLITLDR